MTAVHIRKINAISFWVCLASIIATVAVGLLGIWNVIGTANGTIWKSLASCGTIFVGAVFASLAIRCFKTNESTIAADHCSEATN